MSRKVAMCNVFREQIFIAGFSRHHVFVISTGRLDSSVAASDRLLLRSLRRFASHCKQTQEYKLLSTGQD
jgi:hypothetical protein